MHNTLEFLTEKLTEKELLANGVIPWSSPVPSFGNLKKSKIATLGLNPSDKEFVDDKGNELDGVNRRFHTLNSLNLKYWKDVTKKDLSKIEKSCNNYFMKNPYDRWFKKLDNIILNMNASYYDNENHACHLDLIPYATSEKWTNLSKKKQENLLQMAGDTLGLLIKSSELNIIVLNGATVIKNFEKISNVDFEVKEMKSWTLPRKSGNGVRGYSYFGKTDSIGGIHLNKEILILGYNHNLQSSFGVTNQVMNSIKRWLGVKFTNANA